MNTEDYLPLMLQSHGTDSMSNKVLAAWLKQQMQQQQPPQISQGCSPEVFVVGNAVHSLKPPMTNGHASRTGRKNETWSPNLYTSFPGHITHDSVFPKSAEYGIARPSTFSCEPASNGSVIHGMRGLTSLSTGSHSSIRNNQVANTIFAPVSCTVGNFCDSNFNPGHSNVFLPPTSSPNRNKTHLSSRVNEVCNFPTTMYDFTAACKTSLGIPASDDAPRNVSRQSSPPLSPFSHSGYAESSSPLSNTPLMFANYFLCEKNSEGRFELTKSIPPPPLCRDKELSFNVFFDDGPSRPDVGVKCNEVDSEPPSPKSLKKSVSYNQKPKIFRKKDATKPKIDASLRSNSHYVITPSSATIVALSAEVRSKMGSHSANDLGHSMAVNDQLSSEKNEEFSIPKFATTMEASQTSQQKIHEWDKQFGLRRAHSKTMRESARSRTKVLEFLRGEGAKLLKGMTQCTMSNEEEKGLLDTGCEMPLSTDDDSIGSFSHDGHCDDDDSSVINFEFFGLIGEDEELTRMLRRASLDICSRRSSLVTPMASNW
eukprot:CCRYP_004441-RA/>CCRYP_004441-RA protein AED:0.28 eAED:0.28 QI:770/1/1/1/0/0/2/49/540